MQLTTLREMKEALKFPAYVFRKQPAAYSCDKIVLEGEKSLQRDRYMITLGQCSCMGYAKYRKCKHVQMLRSEDDWVKEGVPASYAVEECRRLSAFLPKDRADTAKSWEIDETTLPEIVKMVSLQIDEAPAPYMVASLRKFPQIGDLGVIIRTANFQ